MRSAKTLPLRYRTTAQWAAQVLKEPLALLADQAYLEKKAANNALEFLNLWPGPLAPEHWLSSVATVAKDETLHLQMVLKLLEKRGGRLAPTHKNPYANDLWKKVRKGRGNQDLVDRLLLSALIEARSCERFERLAQNTLDAELSRFYSGLIASENGHYQLFLEMAKKVRPEQEVEARWDELLEEEARIIQVQPPGHRIHSGLD